MQVETSIPRARSASSMNRPNGSSPTTPKKATRSWSRAAPQAKIADELPTVMWMDRTTRSTSSKTGTGSGSATTMSGLIADDEDVDVAVPAATISTRGTSRRPAPGRPPPGSAARATAGPAGRPARRAGEQPGPVARNRSRASGASSPPPTRPTARRGRRWRRPQAVSTWASNVTSSTPPERRTHGSDEAASSSAQPPASGFDRSRCGRRELGLEDVAAERAEPAGRLDDDLPPGLAGQLLASTSENESGSTKRPGRRRQAAPTRRRAALVGGVGGVGVVVDEELGGEAPIRLAC